jgi:hypothetical protein
MLAFLLDLLGRSPRSGKSTPRRRVALQLEALEDRFTPSTFSVLNGVVANGTLSIYQPYSPFQVSGNNLYVYGTSGNDSFAFTAGSSSNTVTFNGVSYSVDPSQIHNIYFYGGSGTSTATLTDTLNPADATFAPHTATLDGSNYTVRVSNTTYNYAFGSSGDTASFYDSPGNDTFSASGTSANMFDSGLTYINYASGFTTNNAYSQYGGKDTAKFYDTPGDDIYTAGDGYASMSDRLGSYSNSTKGFAVTYAYSSQGGTDTAILYDYPSANNDGYGAIGGDFYGIGKTASFAVGGSHPFNNTAIGFSDVEAYSSYSKGDPAIDFANAESYSIHYTLTLHGYWDLNGNAVSDVTL